MEVGQVDAKEYCPGCTYCQNDEKFGGCEIGGWCRFVPGVINLIATYCQAEAILFLLLGAKISDNPAVSGPFVGRDEQFCYEEARVHALEILYSLEQASYFVHKTCIPHRICCKILDNMPVLQSGAYVFVDDGAKEMVSGKLAQRQSMYPNAYLLAGGVVAVAVTGLGMRESDTALLIMCVVCSLSWLLVMGQAWGVCTHSGCGQVCLRQRVLGGGIKFVNNVYNNGRRW